MSRSLCKHGAFNCLSCFTDVILPTKAAPTQHRLTVTIDYERDKPLDGPALDRLLHELLMQFEDSTDVDAASINTTA